MTVGIGDLRVRLALQAPLTSADGGGGVTTTWALVAEVWAALHPSSGSETFEADGLKGRVSHEIWIRYRAGVEPKMRFVLGTRVFEIRAVIDTGERHRFLRCLVEERIA